MIYGKKITLKMKDLKRHQLITIGDMFSELHLILKYWCLKCDYKYSVIYICNLFLSKEDTNFKFGDIEIISILRNNNYAKLKYHYIIKNDNYVLDTRQMVIRSYKNDSEYIDLSKFFGSDIYGCTRNKKMAIREDLEITIEKYMDKLEVK